MSDNPNALRLADVLQSGADDPMWAHHCEMSKGTCDAAAAELRRLHAENEALKAELAEQARLNGMGSEREARLMAVNAELVEANEEFGKRQEWWNEKMFALEERNAELVEALRDVLSRTENSFVMQREAIKQSRAALARVEASNGS